MNEMCFVLTGTKPSSIPPDRRHSDTWGVMLINAVRMGASNLSSLQKLFNMGFHWIVIRIPVRFNSAVISGIHIPQICHP